MGRRGHTNMDEVKGNSGKCDEDNGDSSWSATVRAPTHQKKINFSRPDKPAKKREKRFSTCQVILVRCDGWTPPGPGQSFGALKAKSSNDKSRGSSTKRLTGNYKYKSGLPNSKIHKTDSRRFKWEQIMDCPPPTKVGTTQHVCQFCFKSFRKNSSLEIHIRSHTGEQPYQCQFCSKSLPTSGSLKMDILTHTCERPCQCQLCGKSFVKNEHLEMHIRTHTGEKPHKCQICSKSFRVIHHLKSHNHIHTGERPYQCKLCSKSFAELGNRNKHIRSHTGERPYHCQLCSYSCGDSSNLKKHIRTQH